MKLHIFKIWNERLHDDQIFDISDQGGADENKFMVTEDNFIDVLESINVEEHVSEEEALQIINDYVTE